MKQISKIQDKEARQTRLRGKLEEKVQGKIKLNRGEELQFLDMQKQKTDELMFKSEQGIQRLGFAATSVGTVLLGSGVFGTGPGSAFGATLLMVQSLAPALGALSTATKQFAKTQMAAIAAIRAGDMALGTYIGKLSMALAPLAAITAATYIFNKGQEESATAFASANAMLAGHNDIMGQLKTQTHLFADENAELG